MELTNTRKAVLVIILITGFILGRLLVRFVLNMLIGGSLFGGNFL